MTSSLSITSRLLLELLFDVVSAPLWWYTDGVRWCARGLAESQQAVWRGSAIGIWMRNLFVPMFGQYDVWGRIISFFIRLFNIIGRLLWNLVWLVFMVITFILWIAAPLAGWALLIYALI